MRFFDKSEILSLLCNEIRIVFFHNAALLDHLLLDFLQLGYDLCRLIPNGVYVFIELFLQLTLVRTLLPLFLDVALSCLLSTLFDLPLPLHVTEEYLVFFDESIPPLIEVTFQGA